MEKIRETLDRIMDASVIELVDVKMLRASSLRRLMNVVRGKMEKIGT